MCQVIGKPIKVARKRSQKLCNVCGRTFISHQLQTITNLMSYWQPRSFSMRSNGRRLLFKEGRGLMASLVAACIEHLTIVS
jgi:hypothetical protein